MEKNIGKALDGIAGYELVFKRSTNNGNNNWFFWIPCLWMLVLSLKKNVNNRPGISTSINSGWKLRRKAEFLRLAALIPSFAILIQQGAAALAFCAVMMIFVCILKAALPDFFTRLRRGKNISLKTAAEAFLKASAGYLPIFAAAFTGGIFVCIAGRINAVSAIAAMFFTFFSLLSTSFAFSKRALLTGHIPFIPLAIRRKTSKFKPLPLVLPWIITGMAAFIVPYFSTPGTTKIITNEKTARIFPVSREDYENHIEFQKKFAFTRLKPANINQNSEIPLPDTPYLQFSITESGLLQENGHWKEENSGTTAENNIPAYPFDKLRTFLQTDEIFSAAQTGISALAALVTALLTVLFSIYINNKGHRTKYFFGLYNNEQIFV